MPRGSPLVTFFVVALALKKTALQIRFFSVLLERFGYTPARLGIEKLMLDALNHMSALYDRVLVACTFMCSALKVGLSAGTRRGASIANWLAITEQDAEAPGQAKLREDRRVATQPNDTWLWTSCMIS